jgi:hypothetical protein
MALSANIDRQIKKGRIESISVKGSTHIYAGAIVNVVASTGYAVPGADTSGHVCAGIALEEADNSSGADGAITVRVYKPEGWVKVATTGTAPTYGATLCVSDDTTVALASVTTNDITAGICRGVPASGFAWLDMKTA